MPTIFLLSGTSSFPNPGDWNPVNTIECVGAGGQGSNSYPPGPLLRDEVTPFVNLVGNGGGGGAYAKGTNINPTFPVTLQISATGPASPQNYNLCSFGGISTSDTGGYVHAADGTMGQAQNGGGFGGGIFKPTGFSGANGAQIFGTSGNGGGGGGAGGPRGNGAAGSTTTGGSGDGGNVASAAAGVAGNKSTYWDSTHGTGGGGGGGTTGVAGAGGTYGGGGGSRGSSGTATGSGTPALIVIIYTPLAPSASQTNAIMMGV